MIQRRERDPDSIRPVFEAILIVFYNAAEVAT